MRPFIHRAPVTCPSCFSRNDMATSPFDREPPKDNDAGLCFTCGEFMIMTEMVPGRARLPTPDEMAELRADPAAREMQRRWKEMVR